MLAHGVELDVPQDHHLVVPLGEADVQVLARVLEHAAEQLGVHLGHALGRAAQALAVGVLPDGLEDPPHGLLDGGQVHVPLLRLHEVTSRGFLYVPAARRQRGSQSLSPSRARAQRRHSARCGWAVSSVPRGATREASPLFPAAMTALRRKHLPRRPPRGRTGRGPRPVSLGPAQHLRQARRRDGAGADELRIAGGQIAVERAGRLAGVAAEYPHAHPRPELRVDRAAVLDGQVADAPPGVHQALVLQRAGGTGRDAGAAVAAPSGNGAARRQRQVADDLRQAHNSCPLPPRTGNRFGRSTPAPPRPPDSAP